MFESILLIQISLQLSVTIDSQSFNFLIIQISVFLKTSTSHSITKVSVVFQFVLTTNIVHLTAAVESVV